MLHALDANQGNKLFCIFEPTVKSKLRSNNYICLSCKNPVKVSKGPLRKYFSHKSDNKEVCTSLKEQKNPALHQAESVIHYLAKEIFSKNNTILIPSFVINSEEKTDLNGTIFVAKKQMVNKQIYHIENNSINIEDKTFKYGIIPDLHCNIINPTQCNLIIEISVTHSCHHSPEKIEKIKSNNLNCIEIDLGDLHEKYLNINQIKDGKLQEQEIQNIKLEISNALQEIKRYEVINISSLEIMQLQNEINEIYLNELQEHNNNIILKRKKDINFLSRFLASRFNFIVLSLFDCFIRFI